MQDLNKTWRETIPYEHFEEGKWSYDNEKHSGDVAKILRKRL